MSCPVCGEAKGCPECRTPSLRAVAEADPAYRELFARIWRGEPQAETDPIFVAVDLCDFRASCSCHQPMRCLLGAEPGMVTIDGDCRRCPVISEPAQTERTSR